ncbi:calmodulin-like protein 4 [Liolophura sinensis]|uniref:calmodulin-like protein 4 n=1 Tax=Liolophura sinensis TaxID=3198878 RepID=UPI003158FF93
MAKHFSQKDIDEFKECFHFNVKSGKIKSEDELSQIMLSLGYSPTGEEVHKYFTKSVSGEGVIEFATFLDIMYEHSQTENCSDEILKAFLAHDVKRKGTVSTKELRNILTGFGDKLTTKEVDTMLREANVPQSGELNYTEFLRMMFTPVPDY